MHAKSSVLIFSLLFLLCSCSSEESNDEAIIRLLGKELENSSKTIESNTMSLKYEFENNLNSPKSKNRALVWQPKVELIEKEFKLITDLINAQKIKENIDWENLNKELKNSKKRVFSIDSAISKEFEIEINEIGGQIDFFGKLLKLEMLRSLNKTVQKTILEKVYIRIKVIEHNLIEYCFLNSKSYSCSVYSISRVLISQNTTHLKTGENLEVTAGILAIGIENNPTITIGNKKVEVVDGTANYKLKVSGILGKHTLPVKIEYTDQNGIKIIEAKLIEYIIDK